MLEMHGPNKMALSPVPVMWEQLPVTEGIFKDDSKKYKCAADSQQNDVFPVFSQEFFHF